MTATTKLRVQPVTSAVGAVLEGVDLREPLDEDTTRLVRQALLDHGVIFFHDQDVTAEQLQAFAGRFGRVAHDNGANFFQSGQLTKENAVNFVEKFGTPRGRSHRQDGAGGGVQHRRTAAARSTVDRPVALGHDRGGEPAARDGTAGGNAAAGRR
jgi:hypothetical protein